MAILTFDQLHAEVAAFHAREAANRTPLAVACRALTDLREALALLTDAERGEVLEGIREMIEGELSEESPVALNHEFQPSLFLGEDRCTYCWRSERTYCQRPEREHAPTLSRCTYRYGGSDGRCSCNAERGQDLCRRHRHG